MNTVIRRTKRILDIIKTSIKVLVRTKSFSRTINKLFYDENGLDVIDHLVTKNGDKYYISEFINTIASVQKDYIFDDINGRDIVIDIGACIGAFSIPVSKKAKCVFAVEPITYNILKRNILLNKRKNINALNVALGDGEDKKIKFSNKSKIIKTKTLSDIKKMCGGCDFLKVDCEGCEWNIKPDELKGIRRIEMEVHEIGFPISVMERRLKKAGFSYEIHIKPEGNIGLWLIHAKRKDEK